eukprot:scaffold1159_cov215-Pinguiococcus_pyrenoidosus.AAC.8
MASSRVNTVDTKRCGAQALLLGSHSATFTKVLGTVGHVVAASSVAASTSPAGSDLYAGNGGIQIRHDCITMDDTRSRGTRARERHRRVLPRSIAGAGADAKDHFAARSFLHLADAEGLVHVRRREGAQRRQLRPQHRLHLQQVRRRNAKVSAHVCGAQGEAAPARRVLAGVTNATSGGGRGHSHVRPVPPVLAVRRHGKRHLIGDPGLRATLHVRSRRERLDVFGSRAKGGVHEEPRCSFVGRKRRSGIAL